MGELGLNKIFGALLATILVIMGLREVSAMVFPSGDGHGGGHHGEDHGEKTMNEKLAERYAYYVDVVETGGGPVVEDVFDLGLALANADPARGETSFKGKCATCHSIEEGGPNGTGPNLFASIGTEKQRVDGFNYSGVLSDVGGNWTYEAMNDWLENPSSYARGTSMAFAGLRRDDERANVIAYLASYTPDAPDFPAPLPEEIEDAALEGDAVEAAATEDGAVEITADPTSLEVDASIPVTVEDAPATEAPAPIDAALDFTAGTAPAGLVAFLQSAREPCTDPDCWYTANITFESDSAVVDAAASATPLAALKQVMDAYPSMQLKVGGYTDNTGDADANVALSQARADAVIAALADLGVSADRLVAEGYGAEFPVASNETEDGRAQNRRIDVRVRAR